MGTIIFFGITSLVISLSIGYIVYRFIIKLLCGYKEPTIVIRSFVFSIVNTPVIWGFGVHTPMLMVTPSIIAISLYPFVDNATMNLKFALFCFVMTLLIVFVAMKYFHKNKTIA